MKKLNDEVLALRKQFLRQFIITALTELAIKNNIVPNEQRVEIRQQRIDLVQNPILQENTKIQQKEQANLSPRIEIKRQIVIPNRPIQRKIISRSPQNLPSRKIVQPTMAQPQREKGMILKIGAPSPDINKNSNSINLGRVAPLLLDPSVQSVECTGSDKPIIVNRSGLIQTTNILLKTDEIQMILESVSKRTRIPLITGVFKAVFDNYLITAVISEYLGSKFIIQKRSPFTQY